jgi:hypothetical protein
MEVSARASWRHQVRETLAPLSLYEGWQPAQCAWATCLNERMRSAGSTISRATAEFLRAAVGLGATPLIFD